MQARGVAWGLFPLAEIPEIVVSARSGAGGGGHAQVQTGCSYRHNRGPVVCRRQPALNRNRPLQVLRQGNPDLGLPRLPY